MKKDIKLINIDELQKFLESCGEKPFRLKQIQQWIWQKNVKSFDQMANIPQGLRQKLSENFAFYPLKITYQVKSRKDNSSKFAFLTHDNLFIEGVLIPSKNSKRVTACISTQVGCPLACTFCATGTMGLKRNLTFAEIYEQAFLLNQEALQLYGRNLTNIVVMGMGEPLLNLDNTIKALNLISSATGMKMSPSRITLSTAGIVKKLYELADIQPKFNLAISLHSAINHSRSLIMPINKTNNLTELIKALKYYHQKTSQRITFEYLMIKNITDSTEHAKALANFCRNFPSKINLIEYNKVAHIDYEPSDQKTIQNFAAFLESKNLIVTIRRSKGQDIDAACGQLALKKTKK